MVLLKHNRSTLTLCFNVFFPTSGIVSIACEWTIALTLASNLSKSGILRRYCATINMISERVIKASTTLSLLLISSTSFNGWQIQLLKSRFPEGVIQLSRYLNNVPENKRIKLYKCTLEHHDIVNHYLCIEEFTRITSWAAISVVMKNLKIDKCLSVHSEATPIYLVWQHISIA